MGEADWLSCGVHPVCHPVGVADWLPWGGPWSGQNATSFEKTVLVTGGGVHATSYDQYKLVMDRINSLGKMP